MIKYDQMFEDYWTSVNTLDDWNMSRDHAWRAYCTLLEYIVNTPHYRQFVGQVLTAHEPNVEFTGRKKGHLTLIDGGK